jgi:hypothetical protein
MCENAVKRSDSGLLSRWGYARERWENGKISIGGMDDSAVAQRNGGQLRIHRKVPSGPGATQQFQSPPNIGMVNVQKLGYRLIQPGFHVRRCFADCHRRCQDDIT